MSPPIPKPSKKNKRKRKYESEQARERRLLRKLYTDHVRPAFLAGVAAGQNRRQHAPLCERCGQRAATQVHHMAGRAGSALLDAEWFAALCFQCHEVIHANPAKAHAEGWMTSRYSLSQFADRTEDARTQDAPTGAYEGEDDDEDGL